MTPFELLAVIEDADVRASPGRRRIILELRAPIVLGQKGRYLGVDAEGVAQYGFTRRQCMAIRNVIYEAARADREIIE